jgi:ABC-type phosphate/phosphonate transport system permease subunit
MFFLPKIMFKLTLYAFIFVGIYSVSTCSELYADILQESSSENIKDYWSEFKECSDPIGALSLIGDTMKAVKNSDFVTDSEVLDKLGETIASALDKVSE